MVVLAIRRADVDDLAEILALERGSEGAPHWSEAVWRELLVGGADAPVRRVVFVAVMDGELVGFVVVGGLADAMEMESVLVAGMQRGKGIGKALCRSAMAWAREQGGEKMELEVRASNVAARAMYVSLGFVEQGRRARYYRDPEEDAVLMAVGLSEV
jgi:ribosomal-protein-alanine acetyltransferase